MVDSVNLNFANEQKSHLQSKPSLLKIATNISEQFSFELKKSEKSKQKNNKNMLSHSEIISTQNKLNTDISNKVENLTIELSNTFSTSYIHIDSKQNTRHSELIIEVSALNNSKKINITDDKEALTYISKDNIFKFSQFNDKFSPITDKVDIISQSIIHHSLNDNHIDKKNHSKNTNSINEPLSFKLNNNIRNTITIYDTKDKTLIHIGNIKHHQINSLPFPTHQLDEHSQHYLNQDIINNSNNEKINKVEITIDDITSLNHKKIANYVQQQAASSISFFIKKLDTIPIKYNAFKAYFEQQNLKTENFKINKINTKELVDNIVNSLTNKFINLKNNIKDYKENVSEHIKSNGVINAIANASATTILDNLNKPTKAIDSKTQETKSNQQVKNEIIDQITTYQKGDNLVLDKNNKLNLLKNYHPATIERIEKQNKISGLIEKIAIKIDSLNNQQQVKIFIDKGIFKGLEIKIHKVLNNITITFNHHSHTELLANSSTELIDRIQKNNDELFVAIKMNKEPNLFDERQEQHSKKHNPTIDEWLEERNA